MGHSIMGSDRHIYFICLLVPFSFLKLILSNSMDIKCITYLNGPKHIKQYSNMDSTMRLINHSGLKSERNLCFTNTAMHLLCNIPIIKDFFKKKEYRLLSEQKKSMNICDEISRLFNIKGDMTTSASELRRLVGIASRKPHLKDGSQQDILEFLLTLLEEVGDEISSSNLEAKTVLEEFCGVERIERKFLSRSDGKCCICKFLPKAVDEKFKYLKVSIPKTDAVVPLSKVVNSYFQESSANLKMKCSADRQ